MFNPAPKPSKKIKKPRKKPKSLKNMVILADTYFSQYIRLRDADDNGNVRCFTCGTTKKWSGYGGNDPTAIQCGHYRKRDNKSLRYNEINCQPQCLKCNYILSGNDGMFRKFLVKKYGEIEVLKLEATKSRKKQFYEVEIIKNIYMQKAREEKQKRGIK